MVRHSTKFLGHTLGSGLKSVLEMPKLQAARCSEGHVRGISFASVGVAPGRDLTQGFFLHLLEHKTLTHINPSKGKFRSFLLASLQKYLSLEATRSRCLKRGGAIEFVFLDAKSAEERYQLEPLEALTPEIIFDARWAMALLAEAKSRLGEEYAADGKSSTFETLKAIGNSEKRQFCGIGIL